MEAVAPGAAGSRMVVVPTIGPEPRPAASPKAPSNLASDVVRPQMGIRRGGRRRWFRPENAALDTDGGGETPRAPGMGPAVGLCAVSTVLAGVVAYGTHPAWAQYPRGLDFILLARLLQWPFIALSLIGAVILAGTVISGRRRVFWLVGLAPILALFGHRFATDPTAGMRAVE